MGMESGSTAHPIYTVGHSNYSADRFLQVLQENDVRILIDVRSVPYSRWVPQFSRPNLSAQLRAAGVRYLWAGKELGGKNSPSVESEAFKTAMHRVLSLADEEPVALMCSERCPSECHRAMKLTAWLHVHFPEIHPQHITPDGLADSRLFEGNQPRKWGWHELFPEGPYGRKA